MELFLRSNYDNLLLESENGEESKDSFISSLINKKDFETIKYLVQTRDFFNVLYTAFDFYKEYIGEIVDNFTDEQLIWLAHHGLIFNYTGLYPIIYNNRYDLLKILAQIKYDFLPKGFENYNFFNELIDVDYENPMDLSFIYFLKNNFNNNPHFLRAFLKKAIRDGDIQEFNYYITLGEIPSKSNILNLISDLKFDHLDKNSIKYQNIVAILDWAIQNRLITLLEFIDRLNNK